MRKPDLLVILTIENISKIVLRAVYYMKRKQLKGYRIHTKAYKGFLVKHGSQLFSSYKLLLDIM